LIQTLTKATVNFFLCLSTNFKLRQKLARFSSVEFSNFILEILNEIKQRYNIVNSIQKGIRLIDNKFFGVLLD
jgi:hypothetical protein